MKFVAKEAEKLTDSIGLHAGGLLQQRQDVIPCELCRLQSVPVPKCLSVRLRLQDIYVKLGSGLLVTSRHRATSGHGQSGGYGYHWGSRSSALECSGVRQVETICHAQTSRFSIGYVSV